MRRNLFSKYPERPRGSWVCQGACQGARAQPEQEHEEHEEPEQEARKKNVANWRMTFILLINLLQQSRSNSISGVVGWNCATELASWANDQFVDRPDLRGPGRAIAIASPMADIRTMTSSSQDWARSGFPPHRSTLKNSAISPKSRTDWWVRRFAEFTRKFEPN